jgi:hypothetical protein
MRRRPSITHWLSEMKPQMTRMAISRKFSRISSRESPWPWRRALARMLPGDLSLADVFDRTVVAVVVELFFQDVQFRHRLVDGELARHQEVPDVPAWGHKCVQFRRNLELRQVCPFIWLPNLSGHGAALAGRVPILQHHVGGMLLGESGIQRKA